MPLAETRALIRSATEFATGYRLPATDFYSLTTPRPLPVRRSAPGTRRRLVRPRDRSGVPILPDHRCEPGTTRLGRPERHAAFLDRDSLPIRAWRASAKELRRRPMPAGCN